MVMLFALLRTHHTYHTIFRFCALNLLISASIRSHNDTQTDGTWSVPIFYTQCVYVLGRIELFNENTQTVALKTIVLAAILLRDKKQATYEAAFRKLKEIMHECGLEAPTFIV